MITSNHEKLPYLPVCSCTRFRLDVLINSENSKTYIKKEIMLIFFTKFKVERYLLSEDESWLKGTFCIKIVKQKQSDILQHIVVHFTSIPPTGTGFALSLSTEKRELLL